MSVLKCVTGRVQGYRHLQKHQPCQDSYKVYREPERAVLAVADGHGASLHCYSADGSRIAVEVAVRLLKELLLGENPRAQAQAALPNLAARIEEEWKREVLRFHGERAERGEREKVLGEGSDERVLVLYGTTLLAVLYAQDFLLALQIGDGDIAYVEGGGNCGLLIPPEEQEGSATYSLCMPASRRYFRLSLVDFTPEFTPLLVFLSTDGYSNSYTSKQDFLRLVREYYEMCAGYDEDAINAAVASWLSETSRLGSGDDITAAILYAAR